MNRLEDLPSDPHLASVKLFVDLQDDKQQPYRFVRNPVRLEGSDVPPAMPPRLGEHSGQLLREAGLSEQQIQALVQTGATVTDPPAA